MSTKTITTAPAVNTFSRFIKGFINDIFLGWTKKEAIYGITLVLLQIVTFIWNPDSIAGFITGLTGTICVLLVAKRRLSNYVFGFIQTAIALYLGLSVGLWGESIENGFYFVAQFIGFAAWRKHMIDGTTEDEPDEVETLKFTAINWVQSIAAIAIGTVILGYIFDITNGTQPYIDALTTITAIVAQIIMLKRYREQWTFWLLLNVVSVYQWYTLDNASMVALYVAFIINNAYGYYEWTKGAK